MQIALQTASIPLSLLVCRIMRNAAPRVYPFNELALLLLVLRIFANDHDAALTLDNLALFADGFYGRFNFHG